MKKIILLITILVLITGCQQSTVCPICEDCNVCDIEPEEPVEEIKEISIKAGLIDVTFNYDTNTLINCGDRAYGDVVVEEVLDIIDEKSIEEIDLIITEYTSDYIGGCESVLIRLPNINKIHFYGEVVDTENYKTILKWTNPNDLVYHEEEFD